MLNKRTFANPPSQYRPGYFWCLAFKMNLEHLLGQLRDMADKGTGTVCMHPVPAGFDPHGTMEPDYLTPEYWAIVKKFVEECERLGMNYYLYDEGGFPSGSACGRVYASDPERFRRHFVVNDGPGKVKLEAEQIGSYPIPDLLEPAATKKFLELTHDVFKRKVGRHFGKTILYSFTDEPQMPRGVLRERLTWTRDFAEEFQKRKGYDVKPWLPKILNQFTSVPDELARKKCDFYDVAAQLFVERYLIPIRDWCRANGLKSGGHFGGEEELQETPFCGYGFILRSLRALDLPGVDMIWRQLYPGRRLHPFPKYASSIANQRGLDAVLGELFAVYGAGLKPQVMHFLLDYMLLCGINTFVFSNIAQSHRDAAMAGCRPLFGETDPLWKYSRQMHYYVGRLGWLCSRGKAVADTAVYYDVNSLCQNFRATEYAMVRHELVSRKLQENRIGFDFVDDDVLKTATISKGRLVIGKMSYAHLLIPEGSFLDPAVEARLDEFRANGVDVMTADGIEDLEPLVGVSPHTTKLFASKWILPGGEALYFLLNTTALPVDAKLSFAEKGKVALCDAEQGKFFALSKRSWHFDPYGSAVFVVGAKQKLEPLPPQPGKVTKTLDDWQLRPISQCHAGEHDYYYDSPDTPAVEAHCGDWRKYLGETFSGDALYTTKFVCRDLEKCRFLDLGEVLYSASVKLNGKEIGKRLWGPFVFDLSPALKKGTNLLEVTVTNTLANVLSPEELKERWAREFPPLSSYEVQQRAFEKDSLDSGLYGPVTLRG